MRDSHAMARRMINASVCAYQIFEAGAECGHGPPVLRRVESDDGAYFYDVVPTYQDAAGFAGPSDRYTPAFWAGGPEKIHAALAGMTDDGHVLIAIRGTVPPSLADNDLLEWIRDWTGDAEIVSRPWLPGGRDFGHAEAGFAEATAMLWGWIENLLPPLLKAAPNGVLITGHSKGGAMSYLLASHVAERWPELSGRIEVHAFAPAVSACRAFVRAYDAAGLGARTFRYQAEHDLVPFLPYWDQADIWSHVEAGGWLHRIEWAAMRALVRMLVDHGYSAPGNLTYLSRAGGILERADVGRTALPAVLAALKAGEYGAIAAAHSATGSYLPFFAQKEG